MHKTWCVIDQTFSFAWEQNETFQIKNTTKKEIFCMFQFWLKYSQNWDKFAFLTFYSRMKTPGIQFLFLQSKGGLQKFPPLLISINVFHMKNIFQRFFVHGSSFYAWLVTTTILWHMTQKKKLCVEKRKLTFWIFQHLGL